MQKIIYIGLVMALGTIHFFNANPHVQELDVGQVIEQVETMMHHRKIIQENFEESVQHQFNG